MVGLVISLWSHITPSGKARERLICRGLPPGQFPVESCHCSFLTGPLPCPEGAETPQLSLTLRNCKFCLWGPRRCFVVEVIQRVDVLGSAPSLKGHSREQLLRVFGEEATQEEARVWLQPWFVHIPPPSFDHNRGVAEPPLRQLQGSPFQAEKAGTHHSGFSFWPRCPQGSHKKHPFGGTDSVSCAPQNQSSLKQWREHPWISQRELWQLGLALDAPGEARRNIAAPPGWGNAGSRARAAPREGARGQGTAWAGWKLFII